VKNRRKSKCRTSADVA